MNLYSMIDQLVEGHQWVSTHLGVVPKTSWSIDPFGHGSTFPYILNAAGIESMIIQVSLFLIFLHRISNILLEFFHFRVTSCREFITPGKSTLLKTKLGISTGCNDGILIESTAFCVTTCHLTFIPLNIVVDRVQE